MRRGFLSYQFKRKPYCSIDLVYGGSAEIISLHLAVNEIFLNDLNIFGLLAGLVVIIIERTNNG